MRQAVEILVNNDQKINAVLITPDYYVGKIAVAIQTHGMFSNSLNYEKLGQELADQAKIATLSVNLRGHGYEGMMSDGDRKVLTAYHGLCDMISVYQSLLDLDFVDPKRIGAVGASFGGMLSAWLSMHRNLASLVLRAPVAYPREMLSTSYHEIMQVPDLFFKMLSKIDTAPSIDAMIKFDRPLTVIASQHDETVPERMAREFIRVSPSTDKTYYELDQTHALDNTGRAAFSSIVISHLVRTLT